MKKEYTVRELREALCVCSKRLFEEDYKKSDDSNFEHVTALLGTARLKFGGKGDDMVKGILSAAYDYYVYCTDIEAEEFADSLYMSKSTLKKEIGYL